MLKTASVGGLYIYQLDPDPPVIVNCSFVVDFPFELVWVLRHSGRVVHLSTPRYVRVLKLDSRSMPGCGRMFGSGPLSYDQDIGGLTE